MSRTALFCAGAFGNGPAQGCQSVPRVGHPFSEQSLALFLGSEVDGGDSDDHFSGLPPHWRYLGAGALSSPGWSLLVRDWLEALQLPPLPPSGRSSAEVVGPLPLSHLPSPMGTCPLWSLELVTPTQPALRHGTLHVSGTS